MADRQGGLAGRTGKGTRTRFFNEGDWDEIPGLDNFTVTSNEPTATTYTAFDGSFVEVGSPEVGDATWDIASMSPQHPSWEILESKRKSQDNVQFRVETSEARKYTPAGSATIAIDTDGVVTFGGTGLGSKATDLNDVVRGLVFKVGGELHVIKSISDDDIPAFVTKAPATAVSAGSYTVVFPILRWEFTGIIKNPFEINVSRDAPITSTLVVTPTRIIELPKAQLTETV